jgi:type IV pilus assembly protein PilW
MQIPGNASGHERGVSLVELMVGMVIGLIGVLLIMQVFSISEGQKRATTGGADAQENGNMALFSVERDLRMAGYAMNTADFLGCTVHAYDSARSPTDFTFKFLPVEITQGTSGAPDTITINYGNSDGSVAGVTFTEQTNVYKVQNRALFNTGDLTIAAAPGLDCTLAEVSGLPTVAGSTDAVNHSATETYTNTASATVTPTRNKSGGLGITYTAGGTLFDVGPAPVSVQYSINNKNQLVVSNLMAVTSFAIAEEIVQMQAEYGKDKVGNDGVVDAWEATAPANAAEWTQVQAVRIAVLARNKQKEKFDASGACATTTDAPKWKDGTAFTMTGIADWQCYRYQVFETIVPLRNMIWKPA